MEMLEWELQRLDEGMPPDQIAERRRMQEALLEATAKLAVDLERSTEMALLMLEGRTLAESKDGAGPVPVLQGWDAYWAKLLEGLNYVARFDCQFEGEEG